MRSFVFLALLSVAFAAKDYSGYQVWRLHPDRTQYKTLEYYIEQLNLDVWSDYRHEKDFLDFAVPAEHNAYLTRMLRAVHSIEHSVMIEDLQVAIEKQMQENRASRIGQTTTGFDYDVYHTYDEIQTWVDNFVGGNGVTVEKMVVGSSSEGREFKALKLSKGTGTKDAFVINCGIHSREWVSPASCMYYAQFLVEYATDSDISNILDHVDFYIIPSSNPDGYVYTWTDDRMWRKTRTACPGSPCTGTDPNRNWDANWSGQGASGSCCSDTYYGPSMMSEPCVQAQANFVDGLSNVKGYIDIHAYSQMWMYPYGYQVRAASNSATLDAVAASSVSAIHSVYGMDYVYGSISTTIYVASGSTADYFFDQGIPCAFASELRDTGDYGFLLPADQILPTAQESFEGVLKIAQAIADGQCDSA